MWRLLSNLVRFFIVASSFARTCHHGVRAEPPGYDDDAAFALQSGLLPLRVVNMALPMFWKDLSRTYLSERRSPPRSIDNWLNIHGYGDVLIVAIHSLGLANRLRVLATAFMVAQDTGRALVLSWVPDVACGAGFTELFKTPSEWPGAFQDAIALYSGDARLLYTLVAHVNWSVPAVRVRPPTALSNETVLVWRPRGTMIDSSRLLRGSGRVAIMRPGSIFVVQKSSCQEYYHRKRQFYRALLASLSDDVDSWVQKMLHVRVKNREL